MVNPSEYLRSDASRRVLLVVWVPSADDAGSAVQNQGEWLDRTRRFLGETFGGATEMPPCKGVWKNPESGRLIEEYPVLLHSYITEEHANDPERLGALGDHCREMGRAMKQVVVAVLLGDVLHYIETRRRTS